MPKNAMFHQPTGPQPLPPSGGGKEGYIKRPMSPPMKEDLGAVKGKMMGAKK